MRTALGTARELHSLSRASSDSSECTVPAGSLYVFIGHEVARQRGNRRPGRWDDRRMVMSESATEISHVEVRRHPIWQREVRHEHKVAADSGAVSRGGRLVLMTVIGALLVAAVLVLNA